MTSFVVVPDACCLIPFALRDTIFRAADKGLYRLCLTDEILEEVRRNLIGKLKVPDDKASSLIRTINEAFPDAFVTGHMSLLDSMPVNDKDRHVLAAAVINNAQVIVTQNIKDFPLSILSSYHVEAQTPDEFLVHLFHLAPDEIARIIISQAGDLCMPSMTTLELLKILEKQVPSFVKLVQGELSSNRYNDSWLQIAIEK